MATATLLYRVDAGPLLSASSTLAGGETISLTAASFAGWAASAALWEILDYPPGWPAPAGWSTDSVNERYYYRASTGPSGVTPPDFVVPTAPTFGKILFRLTVNGTIFSSVLGVKTRSPTIDLDDIAYGESDQWGGPKDWPSDQKDNIRKIDAAALAAAGTEAILVDSTTTAYPSGVPIRAMTTELAFVRDLATSGATADVIDVCRSTGGAGANGDGARLRFRAPDVGSVRQTSASISAEWVNVGVIGGPSSRLVLSTTTGGVAYAGITLSAAGAVRFNGAAYASAGGRFVVDASGNVTLQAVTEAEVRTALASAAGDVDVNGQNLTGVNNLTVGGDLTVSGTTTTVDSTTVTVADRLVVVNSSTGIVPVPVDVAGFVVDRGSADGMTKRDGVGIFWNEANARFEFAYNTALDQTTIGPFVAVKFSGLTLSGLSTGVVHSDASGVLSSSTIVDADVNAAAAIAGTKISPNFGAQNVTTTGSITAGAAGLIAPKWDRANAGALTLGGTNATSIACSGLGLTSCVSVASTTSLALSSANGDATLDADGAHAAKLGTSTAGGVSIGYSGITVTTTSGGEVHAVDDDKIILTQWGSTLFKLERSKVVVLAGGAGTTTAFTFNIPASASGSVLLEVESVDRFNGERATYVRKYSFSRISSGTSVFTAVGADIAYQDDVSWIARVSHSSPTLTAEVAGDAANSTQNFVSWTIRYQTFTPTP
jgi:hypothetical protein